MSEHLMDLAEIHDREKRMLYLFHDFCQAHELRYYICGGTLLGAVRHQDFIPWDDDVDLLMPRPDYERLQTLIREQPYLPRYEFLSPRLDNLYEPFTKLVDKNTRLDKVYTRDKYDKYLWIDIFPMDGLPEDKNQVDKLFKVSLWHRRIDQYLKMRIGKGGNLAKKIIKPILLPFFQLYYGKKRNIRKWERWCMQYDFDSAIHVGGIAYGYGPQESMPREEYIRQVPMRFGEREVMAPGCWDYYLTRLYGDYMQLPPEEKQVAHIITMYATE